MMDRRILIIIGVVILTIAAAFFIFSSDTGDYSRIIVLSLHVGKDGVTPISEEIRYGHPPVTGLVNGAFRGTFTDAKGNIVQDFGIHDPRVQFGDRIAGNDSEGGSLEGVIVVSDEADLCLAVLYTGKEEKFTLSNTATGTPLARVDLAAAIAEFRDTYPEDPGIAVPSEKPGPPISVPIALAGIVLVILLAAVVAMMIRRK